MQKHTFLAIIAAYFLLLNTTHAAGKNNYSKYSFKYGRHEIGSKGWLRIGIGKNENTLHHSRNCYKAKGAKAKYRLGNECDNEIVAGVYHRYRLRGDDGIYLHSQLDLKLHSFDQHVPHYQKIDAAFIELGNIDTPFGNNKIWVGKRNYSLHNIEINDLNLIDQAGKGGGIGEIDIGFGKFAYASLESDSNFILHSNGKKKGKLSQVNHDFRITEIKANKDAKITLWYNHAVTKKIHFIDNYPLNKGNAYGIFHHQEHFLGKDSENKLSFEYGTDLMYDFKGKDLPLTVREAEKFNNSKTHRITNSNIIPVNDKFALATVIIYEKTKSNKNNNVNLLWQSYGMRPMYYITENIRLAFEVGCDILKDKATKTNRKLNKYTLALEYALDKGYRAKPLARVFITKANWSKGSLVEFHKRNRFLNKVSGTTLGVQLVHAW
jgi:maltoporin